MDKDKPDSEWASSVYDMIKNQQKILGRTGQLLEELVSDVTKFKGASEQVAELAFRLDEIEKARQLCVRSAKECKSHFADALLSLETKREANKDKIMSVELDYIRQCGVMRRDFETEIRKASEENTSKVADVMETMSDYRERMAWKIGSISGVIALVVSVIVSLLAWALKHTK